MFTCLRKLANLCLHVQALPWQREIFTVSHFKSEIQWYLTLKVRYNEKSPHHVVEIRYFDWKI